MDLVIRNARLAERSSIELSDIGVSNGRIVAIEREIAAEAEIYNAEGRLAITTVTLRPEVKFGGEKTPTAEEIAQMHEQAHHACFIASSATERAVNGGAPTSSS